MPSTFPYQYTVRISTRAKRISARIKPGTGLEFVLPQGAADAPMTAILNRFRPWVDKHYTTIMGAGPQQGRADAEIPRGIFLHGGKEYISFFSALPDHATLEKQAGLLLPPHTLALHSRPTGDTLPNGNHAVATNVVLRRIPFALAVAPKEPATFLAAVKNWLRAESRRIMEPKLLTLATEFGVAPKEIRFRHTRTRWGSCSAKGTINLAISLIFLPPDIARYVLVHELCHLKEMNHAPAFWREVLALEPNGLELDKKLRAGWRYVPTWL